MATKSKSKSTSKVKIQKRNRFIPILFVGIFAVIGVAFLLRAFAATSSVRYFGVLTKDNQSVSYQVTTGAGNLDIAYSNNTADLTLVVANSQGTTVGSILSKGKKDVSLSIPVTPDTYSFTISQEGGFSGGRKGYKLNITYPTKDVTSPVTAITGPTNTEALKGSVEYTATSKDDTGVQKVEFYVGSSLIATDTSSPYSTSWNTTTFPDGSHALTVKAYDTSGNVGTASASVTVQNKVITQRFPGDSNPLVTGKAYWGASGSHIAEHESATGKSVAIHRSYASSWPGTSKLVNAIKDDNEKNRLPWVSTKPVGWGTFASGSYDAQIDQFLRDIDAAAAGKPVWLTIHHEAENDSTTTGEYTAANYRAMQKKIRQRMTAVGTKNIAFMPIFQGYSWSTSKWNINDFYVEGIWDAIGFDHYSDSANSNLLRTRYYDAVSWIEAKGLPYAVGEYGVRDYGNATQQANELRDFWNWGFTNKKDALGYSYFDSGLNSPDGTWELAGQRLNVWRDILKNDTRVMRVSDLKN